MAGCTSRILFKFTVSSFVVILTVFYFLRRKRQLSNVESSNILHDCIHPSKSPKLAVSMDLIDSETSVSQKASVSESIMHLKEDSHGSASPRDTLHATANGIENGTTCSDAEHKFTNGTSAANRTDKVTDNGISTHLPGSSNTCSAANERHELQVVVNGVASLSITLESDQDKQCNGSEQHNESDLTNGDVCTDGELQTLSDLSHDSSNDECSGDVLSPETSPEPKMPTPDSGLSTEIHSDGGSSTMSEPSDFMGLNGDADINDDNVVNEDLAEIVSDPDIKDDNVVNEDLAEIVSDSDIKDDIVANGDLAEIVSSDVIDDSAANDELAEIASGSSETCRDCSDTATIQNSYTEDEAGTVIEANGGALVGTNAFCAFEFEIPHELCGLLIGKQGRHVKFIKEKTNADIMIKDHPVFTHMKSCAVTGSNEEISDAIDLIRARFPSDKFPTLSLLPIDHLQHECSLPVTVKLPLPEGVTFDVILSTVVTPGHFFVHQPTHPTYYTLSCLSNEMSELYSREQTPNLFRIAPGYIVAAPYGPGWYRAEVLYIYEDIESALLKLLDFGGYITVPLSSLRQMKIEYSCIPFQASECFLGNVTYPEGEEDWSEEAKTVFEDISRGQILQGYIVGYGEHGLPYVHLYKVQGVTSVFINRELVNRGLARWIEHPQSA